MRRDNVIGRVAIAALLAAVAGSVTGAESGPVPRDFAVRSWGRAEGLPGDSVTTIQQTSDGYLWVGTSAGVMRFDGVRFTSIPLPLARSNGPPWITALCEDATGTLWVGTRQDGLFRLAPGSVRGDRQTQGLLDDHIASLAADAEGRLWIGTRSGLNLRADGKFTTFTPGEGLAEPPVSGIHVARSGVVWITTRSGMYQYRNGELLPYAFAAESQGRSPEFLGAYEDRRGNLWAFGDTYLINLTEGKRFNYFRGADATSVRIWSLCEGRDGRLWIGTSGRGLFCFDQDKFQPVTLSDLPWPNDVRAVFEDREGSLWMGTMGGGLFQLRPQPIRLLHASLGLPAGRATCLAGNSAGRTYVAFEAGGLFAGEGERFDRLNGSNGSESCGLISSLWVTPDDTLWVGTLGSGLHLLKQGRRMHWRTLNGLADNAVLAVCAEPDGTAWIGTRAGVVQRKRPMNTTTFGREHGLPGAAITALLPAREGGLWVGLENGVVLQGRDEAFHLLLNGAGQNAGAVLALHEDEQHRLWVGLDGAGLACWTEQRVWRWTLQNGLPDDTVSGLLGDEAENLWLASARGISRVSRGAVQEALAGAGSLRCGLMFETKATRGLGAGHGWPRAWRTAEGALWFATADGVLSVDAPGHVTEPAVRLPVYVENLLVNDQPFPAFTSRSASPRREEENPALRLPVDLRALEIQFTALNFQSPETTRFRHRLEGLDQDWVGDGVERRVRYGRLACGRYRFRVAASQAGGMWVEAAHPLEFLVPTPLWRAPWAIASYLLTAAIGVAGTVRVVSHRRLRRRLERLEQQQALERERMRIARDMHDEIGSKLTKLSFLSERVRMESAQTGPVAQQIESISGTSRELLQTLDEIVWAVNPRNDDLEHLAAYLGQYATEYFQNTTVDCDLRLPRQLPPHPLSAELRHNVFLAFEEALNNVLKHSGAAQVRIEMAHQPTSFDIRITDQGRGFQPVAPADITVSPNAAAGGRGGNGLPNMRRRLTDVGGNCTIQSRPGQGTTVHLRIPLHNDTRHES